MKFRIIVDENVLKVQYRPHYWLFWKTVQNFEGHKITGGDRKFRKLTEAEDYIEYQKQKIYNWEKGVKNERH